MSTVDTVVNQRSSRYGPFSTNAQTSQLIKAAMMASPNWATLEPFHKEALEMIAHKIARILNGDPSYEDNYVDIAGYATAVTRILSKEELE